jgi:hypothetical protein
LFFSTTKKTRSIFRGGLSNRRITFQKTMEVEQAYIDFAIKLAKADTTVTSFQFIQLCGNVIAARKFQVDMNAMKFIMSALLMPHARIIDGKALLSTPALPFGNASEAFEFMTKTLKMNMDDVALIPEGRKISFALSVNGLKKLGERFSGAEKLLSHAQWMQTASELYACEVQKKQSRMLTEL